LRGLLLLLCACGRIGFQLTGATGDATNNDAVQLDGTSGAGFTILGPVIGGASNNTSVAIPIGTFPAGDFIVVTITQPGATVAEMYVSDNGTAISNYTFGARSTDTACPAAIDIWYAAASPSRGSILTIGMSAATTVTVWVVVVRGASAVAATAQLNSQASSTTPQSAARPTPNVPAAYLAAVQSCGNLLGITGPPFTAFSPQGGADVAYDLSPGTSGAQADWASSKATYTSNIIELH
jgi:hypothetical protein